ncbi:Protein of unknown function [Pyronema omphalodes CBS 100304]|uniref:Uncharacterized protein n=1 Tax=Pyronema omphalodes (strain CBS 100304) TaxID=1076935 RepID=U4L1B5_PYROM|nr:Protein of unknown function [Pyronema omphalodes CBS 100304]
MLIISRLALRDARLWLTSINVSRGCSIEGYSKLIIAT